MCHSKVDGSVTSARFLEPKPVRIIPGSTRQDRGATCRRGLKSDGGLMERGAINAESRQRRRENRKWEERSEVEEEEEEDQGKARAYRSITSFLTSLGLFSRPQLPSSPHSPPQPLALLALSPLLTITLPPAPYPVCR